MRRSPWAIALRTLVTAAVVGALGVVALPAPEAQAATLNYKIAVLGDSWASGEGLTPFTSASAADGCDQSTTAWAYRTELPQVGTVQTALRSGKASVQFLACSGATTANLLTTSFKGHAPQIGQMSTSTNLVLLSISGNDLDFVGLLTTCGLNPVMCGDAIADVRANKMPKALAGLRKVLTAIHARVPNAQVLVTGYAPLVGANAALFRSTWSQLRDLAFEYTAWESQVVDSYRSTSFNVESVSLLPSFDGHGDGDTKTAWLFPVVPNSTKAGHPNTTGASQIAKLVSPLTQLPHGTCATVIKSGMTGICVEEVQQHLVQWGYSLSVDGSFGPKTVAAVKAFQKKLGLTVDGLVGARTKLMLFSI